MSLVLLSRRVTCIREVCLVFRKLSKLSPPRFDVGEVCLRLCKLSPRRCDLGEVCLRLCKLSPPRCDVREVCFALRKLSPALCNVLIRSSVKLSSGIPTQTTFEPGLWTMLKEITLLLNCNCLRRSLRFIIFGAVTPDRSPPIVCSSISPPFTLSFALFIREASSLVSATVVSVPRELTRVSTAATGGFDDDLGVGVGAYAGDVGESGGDIDVTVGVWGGGVGAHVGDVGK